MNDVPFDVTEELEVGDLSDVKEEKQLKPASSGVLFEIAEATLRVIGLNDAKGAISEDNPAGAKFLNLKVLIKDGIPVDGEMKYIGSPMFQDVQLYAHPSKAEGSKWYANKQHLVAARYFFSALGFELASLPKINDEFLTNLKGVEIRGDIKQRPVQAKNEDGKWENIPGEFKNEVRNWKAAG